MNPIIEGFTVKGNACGKHSSKIRQQYCTLSGRRKKEKRSQALQSREQRKAEIKKFDI